MVADVLGQQDSTYSGIGSFVDRARAELLTDAAAQLQRKLGGFYEGKLDHLGRGCSCAGVEAGVEIAVEKWPCNRPLHRSTPTDHCPHGTVELYSSAELYTAVT